MLTETMLLFAKPDDPKRRILDYIYLRDIEECELKEDEDSMAAQQVEDEGACTQDPRLRDKRTLEVIFRTQDDSRNCGRSVSPDVNTETLTLNALP